MKLSERARRAVIYRYACAAVLKMARLSLCGYLEPFGNIGSVVVAASESQVDAPQVAMLRKRDKEMS
jgi:hypothetical protein